MKWIKNIGIIYIMWYNIIIKLKILIQKGTDNMKNIKNAIKEGGYQFHNDYFRITKKSFFRWLHIVLCFIVTCIIHNEIDIFQSVIGVTLFLFIILISHIVWRYIKILVRIYRIRY